MIVSIKRDWLFQIPADTETFDWETHEWIEWDVTTSNEVPVRCRTCRDNGRIPSTFTVFSTLHYPDDFPQRSRRRLHGFPGGLKPDPEIPGLYTAVQYECRNGGCKATPRISGPDLIQRYERAVENRIGTIWI